MHLRRGRTYASSPQSRSVSADGALERNSMVSNDHCSGILSRDGATPVIKRDHDQGNIIVSNAESDLTPLEPVQRPPSSGTGAANDDDSGQRPLLSRIGAATQISVNNITLDHEEKSSGNNTKSSSSDKPKNSVTSDRVSSDESQSRSSSRRSRISYVDNEGFSHIAQNTKNIPIFSTPKNKKNSLATSNRFAKLSSDNNSDTSRESASYAKMMLNIVEKMSDEEAKAKIIARAKKMKGRSVHVSSTTKTKQTSVPLRSLTQPTMSLSHAITSDSSDKETVIRKWQKSISQSSKMSSLRTHPSQLIYGIQDDKLPSIKTLLNKSSIYAPTSVARNTPDQMELPSGTHLYKSRPITSKRSHKTSVPASRQIPSSSYLSKIYEERPTIATAATMYNPEDPFIEEYSGTSKTKSNVKMPLPEKFDGSPDFDKFERFIFSANAYYSWAGLNSEERIQHVQSLLKGTAAYFYMQNVARDPAAWTMARFGKELFDYCFPRNFVELAQKRFDNLVQGRKQLLDFIRTIEKLAERTPDVTESQKRRKLFDGANGYLRIGWRKEGLSAELTSLDELKEVGFDLESSAIQTVYEGLRTRRSRKELIQSIGDCPSIEKLVNDRKYGISEKYEPTQHNQQGENSRQRQDNFRSRNKTLYKNANDKEKPRERTPKLSFSEKEELRSNGSCFECKQRGHLARDCPKFRRLQPSTRVHAAAADVGDINNLAKKIDKQTQVIELYQLHIFNSARINPSCERKKSLMSKKEAKKLLLPFLQRAIPFKTDFFGVPEYDPFQKRRFTIDNFDPTHLCLYDWHTGDSHLLDTEMLSKSPKEIIEHIRKEKLLLMLNDDLITKETALRVVEQNNQSIPIQCSMANVPSGSQSPSDSTPKQNKNDGSSEESSGDEALDNNEDALSVFQETYDEMADRLGRIEYVGDCNVLSTYQPTERFTVVPVSFRLIMIADHILNMTHQISFDELFESDFDLNEWVRDEVLCRDEDIPLSAVYFGDGLWDNTWLTEPEEEFVDSDEEHNYDNPLELNSKQLTIRRLASLAHNRRVTEYERYGTNIRNRFPPVTRENLCLRRQAQRDQDRSPTPNTMPELEQLELNLVKTIKGKGRTEDSLYNHPTTIERNAAKPKDFSRKIPKSIVVEVHINGHPMRALIDSGSLADFISSKVVDLLSLPVAHLAKPLPCQLAASGSRTMITCGVDTELRYQEIFEERHFDIINLENYDVILGTPFLYQHKVFLGFNPPRIVIGSVPIVQLDGPDVVEISSLAATLLEQDLDSIREQLRKEATDLCKSAEETPLPPLRVINHRIPLKDENKTYQWRPSRCPEALKHLWQSKRDSYLRTGRWKFATGPNACPMLIVHKKPGPGGEVRIRTVLDKRQVNDNTKKMVSPLPNMETILSNVLRHKYRTLIDGKDAYEQIRVERSDVPRTLFTTPDGSMVSLVMQQGDCNAPATYQSLMNHIFGPCIGVFMDVYLDDIIIYSNTVQEHIEHCRKVFKILRKEKLYLTTADKLQFFATKMKILGHIIDDRGIVMDPEKIESVTNWKNPTNKNLLNGFIGSVGFLAGDCKGIRVPLGILSDIAGSTSPWKWTTIEELAFKKTKMIVQEHRETHRVAIDYSPNAPPVNMNPDASLTGAGSTISQGEDVKTAPIIAFWSGKFNDAQRNYPVHERELLAIVETLKRFRHLLLGIRFRIFTDHKPLEHLLTQKNLSARQQRWIDTLNDFDFEIMYIPGELNTIADALSRMYSDDPPSLIRAPSEFVHDDEAPLLPSQLRGLTQPVLTGHVAEVGLDLLMAETGSGNEPRYQTRSRTGIRQPRTFESTRGIAVLPVTAAARDALARRRQRRTRQPSPNQEGLTSAQPPTRVSRRSHQQSNPTTPAELLPVHIPNNNTETSRNNNIPSSGETPGLTSTPTSRSSSLVTTTVTLSPTPSIDWGEELGILDAPEGFWDAIRTSYGTDSMFGTFPFTHHDVSRRGYFRDDGLLFKKSEEQAMLCVPEGEYNGINFREFFIKYGHSLLAHLGTQKTYTYLKSIVYWNTLLTDIRAYCEQCQICATGKTRTHKAWGLLHPLPIPDRPWEQIGIDFVGPLPQSTNRLGSFDMITVIIDHLTSMVHLVGSRQDYKARDVAELIFENVYKTHGMPDRIISDRDSLFTSNFWEHLQSLVGVVLHKSSAYHPQTDGATERANRTVIQMLRMSIAPEQRDWIHKLPAIEFAFNSATSSTTGYSPFFLNFGRQPRGFTWQINDDILPGVRTFLNKMQIGLERAHDAILYAREKQERLSNRRRRPAPFCKNDLVYISTENLTLPTGRARKLAPKFIGPYRILREITNGATYEIDLPIELRRRGVHTAFHASLLRIHIPNDDVRFPSRSKLHITGIADDSAGWQVNKIKSHCGSGISAWFEVEYASKEISWEPYATIRPLTALKDYFQDLGISKISDLPKGTGTPPPSLRLSVITLGGFSENVNSPNMVFPLQLYSASLKLTDGYTRIFNSSSSRTSKCPHPNMSSEKPTATTAPTDSDFQAYWLVLFRAAVEDRDCVAAPPGYETWAINNGVPTSLGIARQLIKNRAVDQHQVAATKGNENPQDTPASSSTTEQASRPIIQKRPYSTHYPSKYPRGKPRRFGPPRTRPYTIGYLAKLESEKMRLRTQELQASNQVANTQIFAAIASQVGQQHAVSPHGSPSYGNHFPTPHSTPYSAPTNSYHNASGASFDDMLANARSSVIQRSNFRGHRSNLRGRTATPAPQINPSQDTNNDLSFLNSLPTFGADPTPPTDFSSVFGFSTVASSPEPQTCTPSGSTTLTPRTAALSINPAITFKDALTLNAPMASATITEAIDEDINMTENTAGKQPADKEPIAQEENMA